MPSLSMLRRGWFEELQLLDNICAATSCTEEQKIFYEQWCLLLGRPSHHIYRAKKHSAGTKKQLFVRQSDGDAQEILRQLAAVSLDQDVHLIDLHKLHCFTSTVKFYSILQTILDATTKLYERCDNSLPAGNQRPSALWEKEGKKSRTGSNSTCWK